jgi:protein phosphatase
VDRSPVRAWAVRRDRRYPWCYPELTELLRALGYGVAGDGVEVTPPDGRRAIFIGDYGDRGPDTPAVLRLVMSMAEAGTAICLPGNHDIKLVRKLKGRDVQITHGLAETLNQLASEPDEFGETTGETDEFGLPVRLQWASEYRGDAAVVYGHTPVAEPDWTNNTINIDTGCVFGGRLTALRWPERELVSVPASHTYYEPATPFLPPQGAAPSVDQDRPPFLLDVDDVAGKRIIQTALARSVTVREDNAAAAIEVMSRFAIDPRWLVYLPPTMAPTTTSNRSDALEYPEQAFAEYRADGIPQVICEEKHMGSRAIVIVCRGPAIANARFGIDSEEGGVIYTRTGRPFLANASDSAAALGRVRAACDATGLWDSLSSDWVLLDCELMPWSAKAIDLIRRQYAAVGAAAQAGLEASITALEQAQGRGLDVAELLDSQRRRTEHVHRYIDAYRRYVWPVNNVADLRLAPFHVLAAESGVFIDRGHEWHLNLCDKLVDADPDWFIKTGRLVVNVTDPGSQAAGIAWWEQLTGAGAEGMVVKPSTFTARGRKGLVQPGIKCRGREYLRIIYGPEYADPTQLDRLRSRSLGRKRGLAIREFALGAEALARFVRREPLYRVHECVFGVLAMETEPVDPRL